MMSGEFKIISPDAVIVNERIRKTLTNITELAESIKLSGGLIHPIVLTRDHVLVAGERRLTACKQLGLTEIIFQYVDEVEDEDERSTLEAIENLQRVDLSWQDYTRYMETLHNNKKSKNPDWTYEKTAKLIGEAKTTVTKNLAVAKELHNPLVAKATGIEQAANITTRINERRKQDESIHIGPTRTDTHFLNTPFQEWAATYTGPKFNLLHCDFPYGINADKAQQGTAAKFAGYDDSRDTFFTLTHCLQDYMDNFCSESAHMIFWFSMNHYEFTWQALQRYEGWQFDPFPLIWHKSDNAGFLPDSTRGPRRTYETAFFGRRGDRKIIRAKANSYSGPTVEGHTHEKPVEMLTHFMEMLVDENTAILDPTCGSGSALRAACRLGATRFLGLDTNADHIADANRRFTE